MRNAGAVIPSSTASASAGPSSSRTVGVGGRASDRRRKTTRRDKARKSSLYGDDGGAGSTSAQLMEEREFRVALHMDMLEGVNDTAINNEDHDDDEYDEFAELNEEEGGRSKKKRRRKAAAVGGGGISSTLPKYLRPRSLASILIEEASRSDSVAKQYVEAAVRPIRNIRNREGRVSKNPNQHTNDNENTQTTASSNTVVTTITKPYPPRKFCPVTGLFGEYTEPKSGIPYATLPALDQIRERAPPWMAFNSGGSASYWEAIKSLQNDV